MHSFDKHRRYHSFLKVISSLLIVGGLYSVYRIRRSVEEKPAGVMVAQELEISQSPNNVPSEPAFDAVTFGVRVREAGNQSELRIREAEAQFQKHLRELLVHPGFLQWLEEAAVDCGEQMNRNQDLLNLIRYSAVDTLRKTNRVEDWVGNRLDSQLNPWVDAFTEELHLAGMELDRGLSAAQEMLAYDLAMAAHETHAPMAVLNPETLKQELLKFSMDTVALNGGILVAVTPLEIQGLVTSRFLGKIPPMVSRLVAKIFHKQVAIAAVGISAPLADGPLPVGDIVGGVVAVGGTVYTVVEWNKLKRDLQENVESGVRKQLHSMRTLGPRVIQNQGADRIAQARTIQKELLVRAEAEVSTQIVRN